MATEISILTADVFSLFDRDWALLTAGTLEEGFNAMTISWGQLGSLWGNPGKAKKIATVFVKPVRYTYKFMEKSGIFTICWFPGEFRKDLGILGSKSGRDGDKLALTGLSPKAVAGGVGYEQASLTLVCRKIYSDKLDRERIPADAVQTFYLDEEPHHLYIGEVVHMECQA